MFVDELTIREFRGIRTCKGPLKLSNFTVMIGRNNSGKSTILEALSLLPSPHTRSFINGSSKIKNIINLHHSKALQYLYAGSSQIEYRLKDITFKIEPTPNILIVVMSDPPGYFVLICKLQKGIKSNLRGIIFACF